MPTANLPENIATTYSQATYTASEVQAAAELHRQHTDAVHKIVNKAQVLLRWDPGTGQWETRPAGVPYGVLALSTNDENAVPPHTQAQTGFIIGDVWEWHPDGGPS